MRKGTHHTPESIQKQREKMKGKYSGEKHPLWGKHRSEETKQKIREHHADFRGEKHPQWGRRGENGVNWGKHQAESSKQKIRETHLGEKNPMYGAPPWNKGKKDCFSEEILQKMEGTQFKPGLVPWNKGKPGLMPIPWNKGKTGYTTKLRGSHPSEETKQKMRERMLKKWQNEEFVKNTIEKLNIKPNGAELYLDFLLQNHFPDEWEFTGDGGFILHGLCPDFINRNGKKQIIELFGEHWHRGEHIKYIHTEKGRREVFARSGYDLLIIWDYELSDEQKVIEKIKNFMVSP